MTNNTFKQIKEIGFTFFAQKDYVEMDFNKGDKLEIIEFNKNDNMYKLENKDMCNQWLCLNEQQLLEAMFTKEELAQYESERIDQLISIRKTLSKYLTSEKEKIEHNLNTVNDEILELYKQKEPFIYNGKTKDEYFQSIAGKVFEENDYTITLGTPLFDQLRISASRDLFIETVTGQYHETEGILTVQSFEKTSRPKKYPSSRVPFGRRNRYDEMNKLLVKYGELGLSGKL
ncbi:hypothetical protein bcgnr5390_12480 [Bacillus luti]|nr:hypothetical protein BC2903_51160 [Bacillus cereus]